MKVEFLNPERTEVLLTRGHLWWKRQARATYSKRYGTWLYANDVPVGVYIADEIAGEDWRIRCEEKQNRVAANWKKP